MLQEDKDFSYWKINFIFLLAVEEAFTRHKKGEDFENFVLGRVEEMKNIPFVKFYLCEKLFELLSRKIFGNYFEEDKEEKEWVKSVRLHD